jgi:hypothetical protein
MLGSNCLHLVKRTSDRYINKASCVNQSTIPCDIGSLHQFRDIFSHIGTRALSGKLSHIQSKLLKRKNVTSDVIQDAVQESLTEIMKAGVESSKTTELAHHLRRCICCSDFKKALRSDKQISLEESLGQDESSVPPGLNLDRFTTGTGRTKQGPTVSACFTPMASFPSIQPHPYTCYIYNLPLRVDEATIRAALCNVGDPDEVFLYDTRGIPVQSGSLAQKPRKSHKKISHESPWMRFASPVNAIVKFNSESAFSRATTLQNKLFGIQCRSTDRAIDNDRPMLIEPANLKRHLLVSGFPKSMTWEDFKNQFESITDGVLDLANDQVAYSSFNGSCMHEQRLDINVLSFGVGYEVLKRLHKNNHLLPSGVVVAFSRLRTNWVEADGQFSDAVCFEINS